MKSSPAPSSPRVIRRVVLRTAKAARLAEFYRDMLGLVPRLADPQQRATSLHDPTTGDVLLTLLEDEAARPAPPEAPGLFHIAFLFAELDGWRAAVRNGLALTQSFHGASDHGVSWAVYLEDPDGNGLELAWDKPAHEWPWCGDQIAMVTLPLPLRSILVQGDPKRADVGPFTIGHLHLQVSDLAQVDEYITRLGLRITQSEYPGALFLARGNYHHHLAINTWRTDPHVSRPENSTGLMGWEMTGESGSATFSWRDASGSLVTLVPA